jgi:hypothetical protein
MLHPRNFNRDRGFNLGHAWCPLKDKALSKNNKRKPNKFMVLPTSTLLNYAQLIS